MRLISWLLCGLGCVASTFGASEKIRVLIIDGQNNHDWPPTTVWLKKFLTDEGGETAYAQAGAELNHSGKTIAVAVHRIRRRFRQLVRSAIAETVSTPDEVEDEYRSLFG